MTLSGGTVYQLWPLDTSEVTIYGYDFQATGGLSIEGDKVMGTGVLAGKWFDGTDWTISIGQHDPGAKINLVVPEPATLSLLALGGLTLIRRRRRI